MRSTLTLFAAGALAAAALAPTLAEARPCGYGYHHEYCGGVYVGAPVYYAPRYYAPRYYAPRPVYVAPPPLYYAPPPVYYGGPAIVAPSVSLGINIPLR
jgi:hypothetical protein